MKLPISEFRANCTRVLREVAQEGQRYEITTRGKVVAVVEPPEPPTARDPKAFWNSLAGTSTEHGDITAPAVDRKGWDAARSLSNVAPGK